MTIETLYSVYKKKPVVCTDSRSITDHCIFFALKGESFNGNEYAESALQQGAAYAVIDERKFQKDERYILVADVLKTLQQLANYHRKQLSCPVIAITGSNGKTTTKELISSVLSKKFKTHFTKGNLNNHIGVPLTILSAPADVEMLVVEMGANHLKEIELLSSIAEPDYGLITNIGKAHLEGFGSFDGVKQGKGELYEFLASHNGLAFVNGDNSILQEMLLQKKVTGVVRYGKKYDCECEGKLLEAFPFLKIEWKYDSQKGIAPTQLIGEYNFENALAAICIGSYFEIEPEIINSAIQEYAPGNSRSQVIHKGTNVIILDAYNANPSSMTEALKNFASIKMHPKIVFLGEMSELGKESASEHLAIVALIEQLNFESVVLVGEWFQKHADRINATWFASSDQAAQWAKEKNIQNASLLIKGSRSVKMEKVMEGL
jgi:UDP-N-acetylmuramoyl-tripeptide--D-alanyl-D-alanine ligase